MSFVGNSKSGGSAATPIGTLLSALGPTLLDALVTPAGLEVPVRGTVIYDPVDPIPLGQDCLLILVGVRADSAEAPAIIAKAAGHGFTGVVIKLRGAAPDRLLNAANDAAISLLAAADDVPWRHLDGLLVSVLGASRGEADGVSGRGEALFAVANAVAAIVGGSVAIEDLSQNVLAYSSVESQRIDPLRERGILDRRVPDQPHNRVQYLQVLQSPGVTRFPALGDELPRAALAVRAGDLPLGTIWAIEGNEGLSAEGHQALLDGARVAALHMLREQDVREREAQLRGEFLRTVLAGAQPTREAGARLGLPADAEICLVALSSAETDDSGLLLNRLGKAADQYAAAYRPDVVTTVTLDAVYLLVPGSATGARRFAEGVLASTRKASDVRVRGAISAPAQGAAELVALRREVDAILRATSQSHDSTIASVADVHTTLLLDRVADELSQDPRLRHPQVEAMAAHDRERGTAYAASVLSWLDAQGDIGEAAQHLQVHPNTLRYRLGRAETKFGLDLADPDERLSAWLQLRLLPLRP